MMTLEASLIHGLSLGVEYVNGYDIGDDDVSLYLVFDLGFIRLMFTFYKQIN
jgi:hypothetical protein